MNPSARLVTPDEPKAADQSERATSPEPRLRVLHIVEASFAGVGRHVLDLAEGLVDQGVDSHIFFSPTRASASFLSRLQELVWADRVTTSSAGFTRHPSLDSARAVRAVQQLVHEAQPSFDLIHGHSTGGGLVARAAGKATGLPTVFTPNAFLTLDPNTANSTAAAYRAVERSARRITDGLICVSAEEASHAKAMGYAPTQMCVIPNGIEAADPGPAPQFDDLRHDPAERLIGFVGRFDHQKRPDQVIRAFAHLHHEMGESKTRLVMMGDGELADDLQHLVRQLRIGRSVTFLGEDDGPRFMHAIDVLATPSAYEGFPYVVLEALRAGTPVVGSEELPTRSFGPAPTGLTTVETSDERAFAQALNECLRTPFSREEVRETQAPFTVTRMVEQTAAFYQELMAGQG